MQFHVHFLSQGIDLSPLSLGIGFGDARILMDAGNPVVEFELDFTGAGGTGDRRGAERVGCACQGDVAFARKETGGCIQAQPPGARNIDFGPCMQVGEVGFRTGRAVQCLDVGSQLDQVSGYETGGQTEVAHDLHHQPGIVAAGALFQGQGFLAGLHAGIHADQVAQLLLQAYVQVHQEIDGRSLHVADFFQPLHQQRTLLGDLQVRCQVLL